MKTKPTFIEALREWANSPERAKYKIIPVTGKELKAMGNTVDALGVPLEDDKEYYCFNMRGDTLREKQNDI